MLVDTAVPQNIYIYMTKYDIVPMIYTIFVN